MTKARNPMSRGKVAIPQKVQCGAKTRRGTPCTQPPGHRTPHPGEGKCWLHGGLTPIKHGRYSTITRTEIRQMIEKHEADPDPLNMLAELAAARALFEDYVNRYSAFTEALLAWHESYQASARPLSLDRILALKQLLDEYDALLQEGAEPTDKQEADLKYARETVDLLSEGNDGKPMQILDISSARKILSEITKIVERIEKIRSENAIARPDLLRIMGEMGRVVDTYVPDPLLQQKIKESWLAIRV